jgi:hypothetical protein
LKRIIRRRRADQPAADAVHGRAVPADQLGERGLVPAGGEPGEQVGVRDIGRGGGEQLQDVSGHP